MTDTLLSIKAAAERLGVSYTYLWRSVRRGDLPTVRLGSVHRISERDLAAYVETRRTNTK